MIGEVLEPGLDAPIVFARYKHEPVSGADLAGKHLEGLRRFAFRIFLVHPVEHREIDRLGVDQLHVLTPMPQAIDHKLREPDTHPIGTIGAINDQNAVAHIDPPSVACRAYRGSSLPACSATMYSAYQSGQFASRTPVRFSCSPCAASARRNALANSATEANLVSFASTRPGKRAVTSCKTQLLPSGSLKGA